MESRKKTKVIVISIILGVLALFLVFLLYTKLVVNSPEARSEKANNKLNDLGGVFYSHYYDSVEETSKENTKNVISNYKDVGFTITLKDLKLYLDTYKIEDYSALDDCNEEQTKVTVYPVEPFGKEDYNVRVILECPFSK